jgi:ubiquinone/menaquinone biosynthesis C-methylase UbiE
VRDERQRFWSKNQPGFRFSNLEPGSPEFFAEVEAHRYALEPHIPQVVRFEEWRGRQVLEAGCGIATDGLQFARAGALYTGLDMSPEALALARHRFDLERRGGRFVDGSVTELPFPDESFDMVFSHGVIHHVPDTERAVAEFHRVLRPGGTALAMVYHRDSINYRLNIMVLRRLLISSLLIPGAPATIARVTGEQRRVLEAHMRLLRKHGARYLKDRRLFLSNNTDGPGNPLSKVYSREDATSLFSRFRSADTDVRFLNLRIYPGGQGLAATRTARRLERRLGWHLYIRARK